LLDTLDDLGHVVGAFDNEPANCNLFLTRWPDAVTVLLDTQRAPHAPPLDPRAAVVRDFGG
jgi:hypothetical protein